jgi:thiamine biosynthesis lipoprotein
MGTVVSFRIRQATDDGTAVEPLAVGGAVSEPAGAAAVALRRAVALLHRVDEVFSTWKEQSPISRLRRGEIHLAAAPPEVAEVLALCENARAASGGWFDPWRLPGGVDPTGLVKGWAAQRALGILRQAGVAGAMVNAGGDIAVFGEPDPGQQPWRLGIRDPRNADGLLWVVSIEGSGAVATSGSYERGAHIIDPETGRPATEVLSATVAGPDLTIADALATAAVASGGRALEYITGLRGYSALVMGADLSLRATSGFPGLIPVAA